MTVLFFICFLFYFIFFFPLGLSSVCAQKRSGILKHHDAGNYTSRLTADGSSLFISDGAIFWER